jgi:hypothetical protein
MLLKPHVTEPTVCSYQPASLLTRKQSLGMHIIVKSIIENKVKSRIHTIYFVKYFNTKSIDVYFQHFM